MYQPIYERCQAITRKGTQCRNYVYGRVALTTPDGRFCTQHELLINGRTA